MYQECTHICKIAAKTLQQDFEGKHTNKHSHILVRVAYKVLDLTTFIKNSSNKLPQLPTKFDCNFVFFSA